MSNESKLGLVIGVGLVILVAVLYFRRDGVTSRVAPESAVSAKPGAVPSPTIAHQNPKQAGPIGYKHVVTEGDTLFNLAQRYYNDRTRFGDIFHANREVLTAPDQLPLGTVLFIPNHD